MWNIGEKGERGGGVFLSTPIPPCPLSTHHRLSSLLRHSRHSNPTLTHACVTTYSHTQ